MKVMNRLFLVISCVLMSLGFFGSFIFAIQDSLTGIVASIIVIAVGALLLNHWSAVSYTWTCEKCQHEMELNDRENFVYQNIGVLKKSFDCDCCNAKSIFVGEIKME